MSNLIRHILIITSCIIYQIDSYAIDMSKTNIISAIKASMDYSLQRQVILSENISNANVPKFKSRDVIPKDFNKMARRRLSSLRDNVRLVTTNRKHIVPRQRGQFNFRVREDKKNYETSSTGNSVVLEEQMFRLTENNADYALSSNLYKKMIGLIKTSIASR